MRRNDSHFLVLIRRTSGSTFSFFCANTIYAPIQNVISRSSFGSIRGHVARSSPSNWLNVLKDNVKFVRGHVGVPNGNFVFEIHFSGERSKPTHVSKVHPPLRFHRIEAV